MAAFCEHGDEYTGSVSRTTENLFVPPFSLVEKLKSCLVNRGNVFSLYRSASVTIEKTNINSMTSVRTLNT